MGGVKTLCAAHYRTGAVFAFSFKDGRVASRTRSREQTDLVFGPGFLDLQCNGHAGVDFNHPETSPEQSAHAIRAMWRTGCTLVLPTVVTNRPERIEALFRNLTAALREDAEVRRSAPGFHLEGPFISPEEGARGAHPLACIMAAEPRLWRGFQKAAEGAIRLVTVAPEIGGALPLIRALRRQSVLPAVGHTMANAAQVAAAAEAGALACTHLGNGCPQLMHRHYNPMFAQLGEDRLAATIIPDGVHLPPEVVRTIARVKGANGTILVSDAMAAAGAPPGCYTLGDLTLEVGKDRVVRFPGAANFAGSALTMEDAVSNYARMTGAPLADAWDAASIRPLRLLQSACGVPATAAALGVVIARRERSGLKVAAALRGGRVLWMAEPARA